MEKNTLARMPHAHAYVIATEDGTLELVSYDTIVLTLNLDGWLVVNGTFSSSTRRHISAFMAEYGNGFDYYDARNAYMLEYALNIYTGEKELIAAELNEDEKDW